jgi:hypothetical protein
MPFPLSLLGHSVVAAKKLIIYGPVGLCWRLLVHTIVITVMTTDIFIENH